MHVLKLAGMPDYHRTILLMWPQSQDFTMKIKVMGVKAAVTVLCKKIALLKNKGALSPDVEDELKSTAKAIIACYFDSSKYGNDSTRLSIDALAAAAVLLKDAQMLLDMLRVWSAQYINVSNWIAGVKAMGFLTVKE